MTGMERCFTREYYCTRRAIDAFRRYPRRALCTARSVTAALAALAENELDVDWIVGHGGAVLADGRGATIFRQLWHQTRSEFCSPAPPTPTITYDDEVVQISAASEQLRIPLGCRAERYQGVTFAQSLEQLETSRRSPSAAAHRVRCSRASIWRWRVRRRAADVLRRRADSRQPPGNIVVRA